MTNHEEFEKYKKLLEENGPSECQACAGPLMLEKVNLEDYQGGKLYMMEKIPAYVCQNCGEVWVPQFIMKDFKEMINTVKLKRKNKKNKETKKTKGEKNGNRTRKIKKN